MPTLFDKIWSDHVVKEIHGQNVLYIDTHFIHEVTSPQAFEGLKSRGIGVFRPQKTIATADHNIPTKDQHLEIKDLLSRKQVATLTENCKNHNISLYGINHPNNGIVHVIGPELGITQPGKTIVCGDSHTSTHGAFGAIAFGIGTSEVEMVLATQCLMQAKPKNMRINVDGKLADYVTAKDIILYIIAQLSSSGGTGYFIEYAGSTIQSLSMEGRMTICNMSIEMGARGGLIAPDETTFAFLKNRPFAPQGKDWGEKLRFWQSLKSDEGAQFDKEISFRAEDIEPMVTFGTNPGMGTGISQKIPTPKSNSQQTSYQKSLQYMDFSEGESMEGKPIDYVFLGSCTNGRIEDIRAFAHTIQGHQKSESVNVWVVPGSKKVEQQIRDEGLEAILNAAGIELRQPGCSACLGMNEDKIPEGKYCLSTSNRNFEGRQGPKSRTLLCSPIVAAVSAIEGQVTHPQKFFA